MTKFNVAMFARQDIEVEAETEEEARETAVIRDRGLGYYDVMPKEDWEVTRDDVDESISAAFRELVCAVPAFPEFIVVPAPLTVVELSTPALRAAVGPCHAEHHEVVLDWLDTPEARSLSHAVRTALYGLCNDTVPVNLSKLHKRYYEQEFPRCIRSWGRFNAADNTIETEEGETVTLPADWISKGLRTLARSEYSRIGELMQGRYDTESLDCLVQAAVFGEVIYG